MRVLAAITLLVGASALVPPIQRRSGVALRAGFGGAATKKTKKFVKPGKVQCINQILAARLRHCYYHGLHFRAGPGRLVRRREGGLRSDAQEERDCYADAVDRRIDI